MVLYWFYKETKSGELELFRRSYIHELPSHLVTLLGTWPTFFFLFLTVIYLYDHMTSTHMTDYLYIRAILLGTSLFPPFVCFLLFSPYGSL